MSKHAVVLILTHDAAGSIGAMIDFFVRSIFPRTQWGCSLVVVVANPGDRTSHIAKNVMKMHPEVHMLVAEEKEAIGAAYIDAFAYADQSLRADVLVEWDEDFQHPSDSLSDLLLPIERGADLVIGCRNRPLEYLGPVDLLRLSLRKAGAFLVRLLVFFPFPEFRAIADPTAGLRATRVDGPFQKLHLSSFGARGLGCKIEMLYRLVGLGAQIAEVPLESRARSPAESRIPVRRRWNPW